MTSSGVFAGVPRVRLRAQFVSDRRYRIQVHFMNHHHRMAVFEALDQLGVPAGHEELAAYARVFLGTEMHRQDLATLRQAERRAWKDGERRDTWICPAILDHRGFPADADLLTRSDWPLENRVLITGSEAVRNLWILRRLSWLVLAALREDKPGVDALMDLAARRAALLLPMSMVEAQLRMSEDLAPAPATSPDGVDPTTHRRFVTWGEMAEEAYELLVRPELPARQSFANRLRLEANVEIQLFGADL